MSVTDSGSNESAGPDRCPLTPLVPNKPSSLPIIFEYVVEEAPTSPKHIKADLGLTKSGVYPNLRKLRAIGLIEKVERGVYRPASTVPDPIAIYTIAELRSMTQYEVCRVIEEEGEVDVAFLADELGMVPQNVRDTANLVEERGFIVARRQPHPNSKKWYRLTEEAVEALDSLDATQYLGWEAGAIVPHATGIEGTPFRTAYEIEDAYYLREAATDWIHPTRLAADLDRDPDRTRGRFVSMAEQGLLESRLDEEKLYYTPTERARALFDELRLYEVSRRYGLDFYSIAVESTVDEPFTMDELYTALLDENSDVTIPGINQARDDLKHAGLLEGDTVNGYTFTLGMLRTRPSPTEWG